MLQHRALNGEHLGLLESLATDRETAFCVYSFHVLLLKIAITVAHPSGDIYSNRFWETRKLATFLPVSSSFGLSIAIGSWTNLA